MRLNKIAKDFNVGIQTLVDFLEKKGGDPNMSWNPMSQVPDHLYELLSKEFNRDKSVKQASERERQERMLNRDKMKEEARQINAINKGIPQTRQQPAKQKGAASSSMAKTETEEKLQNTGVKVVGHIDLDGSKKSEAPKPEAKAETPAKAPETQPEAKKANESVVQKPAEPEVQKPAEKAEPEAKKPAEPEVTKPVEKAWQQQFAATYAAPGMKVEFF